MESQVVYETDDYIVTVGLSISIEPPRLKLYRIINKEFDLVEVETSILVRAIALVKDYQSFMDTIHKEEDMDDSGILEFNIPDEDDESA